MLSITNQSSLALHQLFNKEKTNSETENKLDFISSIWDDDQILRLGENNWQCLWCNTSFQVINANKALVRVLGKNVKNIKICYVPQEKAHIRRYQELQH